MNGEKKIRAGTWQGILFVFLTVMLSGCKTIQYVPVETVRTEFKDRFHRDSIHVFDSVYVREKGDTVWLTRWRTEYKDRLIRDSIFICDTIQIAYPVERQLTKWEKTQMNMGAIAMGCVLAMVAGLIIAFVIWIKK